MTQGINLIAVYVADFIGILLLVLILLSRGWEIPGRRDEGRILLILILATLIDCIIDPFIFAVDGRPGKTRHIAMLLGNSALFLYNLVVGTGILALVVKHINKKISRVQYIIVWIITGFETLLLVVNLFVPLVFAIDENNIYSRRPFYYSFYIAAVILLVYSLVVYILARIRDGSVRYFPVWEFTIPIVCGVTIQAMYYGISTQAVCFAVAFCSIILCLQKESLYVDKLTGVYNRYELDKIIRYYKKRKKRKFAAIMLDMNGFKAINDDFSHGEGDEALISMAAILRGVVGNEGDVIRFAGDEFVLILDVGEDDLVEGYCDRIRAAIEEYNSGSGKPYKLSASMGGSIFDMDESVDVVGRIDRLMYENKVEFYKSHDRRNRD